MSLCGVLVFDSVTRSSSSSSSLSAAPAPSFTHTSLSHTTLSRTSLSHTTLSHTLFHIQLCHTPSFTYNFVTHHLSHPTLSHTICHTQLCHTPSFTHTRSPVPLRHFARQVWHLATSTCTLVAGAALMTLGWLLGAVGRQWRRGALHGRRSTWRHGRSICVARATLLTLGWLWSPVWVAGAALCVAGVALGDIHLHFAWQAWRL